MDEFPSFPDIKPTKHITPEIIAQLRDSHARQEELSRQIKEGSNRLKEIAAELRAARLGRGA